MPSEANLATSVQPSLARGVPPIAAANDAAAGSVSPGLAPSATSVTRTSKPANTSRT